MKKKKNPFAHLEKEYPSSERFFFTADSWLARWVHYNSDNLGLKPSEFIKMIVNKAVDADYRKSFKRTK